MSQMISNQRRRASRPLRATCYALMGAAPLNFVVLPAVAQEADASRTELEEIVVTGSYIKRDKFDMASPVEVIGGVQVQETGQANIGQYVRDLTYTSNVDTVANVLDVGDGLQSSDAPRFNLRGLGITSTLTLFDGRRAVDNGSVNTLVPDIAIDRIEVLLDGGSALYGTDAVAGVVNIVPIKKYNGMKVSALYNQDKSNDFHETQASILGGGSFGNLDIVSAFSFAEKTLLRRSDRPEFLRADTDESTSGNPGNFTAVGSTTPMIDPSCATFNGTATDDGLAGAFPSGRRFPAPLQNNCYFDFGEFNDLARPGTEYNNYTNLTYALNDSVSLELQANLNYRVSQLVQSPSTAGTANHRSLLIPASHPANPFGVDVRPSSWRPFTRIGTLPSFLEDEGFEQRDFTYWTTRFKLGSTYQFGNTSWSGETWVSQQTGRQRQEDNLLSFSRLQAAFNGQGGPNGNQYFNPFGSADPRAPAYVAGQTNNTQELVDWLYVQEEYESRREEFWYVESIATGDVFELPSGTLKSAVGFQVRETHIETSPSNLAMARDSYTSSRNDDPPQPTDTRNEVRSVFMELDVPILQNLSLQTAVRYEEFKDLDLEATKPKVSLRYTPIDTLALRASFGESFLAPTVAQKTILRQTGCGEVFSGTDPFRVTASATLIGSRQCTVGNSLLEPEESEIVNVGFTWQPSDILDGLEISLDYQMVDYQGRIIQASSQETVDRDFANFLAATGTTRDAFYALPTPAARLAAAQPWFAAGMTPLIQRTTTGSVAQIDRRWQNVADVEISLFDFRTRYGFDTGAAGYFSIGLSTTYYEKYEYASTPGGVKIDGAGKQNATTNIVPPLPEFKHNLRLDWNLGQQNASISATYLDAVLFDATGNDPRVTGLQSPKEIDAYTSVDVRYSYKFEDIMNGNLLLAIGSNNVLDAMPDPIPINVGFESRLHDPFGRTVYLELGYDFE